ncbi:MAG: hypothetical protein ACR2PT_01705 [Endozoicomonas sp.]
MALDAISRYILAVVFFPFFFSVAQANEVLVGSKQSLPFTYHFQKTSLQASSELNLEGINNSDSALILIVRIDSPGSYNYKSRFNREFSIQPGPFSLTIPLTALRTFGGDPLPQPYKKMIIFTAGNSGDIELSKAVITRPPKVPMEILAIDFGRVDSPVFPGFQLILPDDGRIQGDIRPRFRPSGDPLIQDGFEGISQVSIPWKNGNWRLTLWTQEQGEWEYLPHYLKRRITAEGQEMVNDDLSIDDWINRVYLAGGQKEALLDGDTWELIGQRRSGLISKTITIEDGKLDITLEGERIAKYLAALVIEPVDGKFVSQIEQERRRRFQSTWAARTPRFPPIQELTLTDISRQPRFGENVYNSARSTQLNLAFEINSPVVDDAPVMAITNPRTEAGDKLKVSSRYGHWRYERPTPNASSLIIRDSYLRADIKNMTLSPRLPRRLHLQIDIPADAAPGLYEGSVQLYSNNQLKMVDYAIRVLPTELPKLITPVGLYLEPAPYYKWFKSMQRWTTFATACDLSFLSSMGFTTVAPSLATPDTDAARRTFIRQMMQLEQFGFQKPVMAYAPLKRLLVSQTMPEVQHSLRELKTLLGHANIPEPYWSIYDEPDPQKIPIIKQTASMIHQQPLAMKTAGHLNNPGQKALIEGTDLVIMNHGFGVSDTALAAIHKAQKGRKTWLYNMPVPRLAAGFYLWRSGANGYLQWHGRMPTADPFDPTDGREGDVIYLYPWQGSCPDTMNIHQRLLNLQEATLDLRWLQWLDEQAGSNKRAAELRKNLKTDIPGDWQEAKRSVSETKLLQMRHRIMDLLNEPVSAQTTTPKN